MILVVDDDPAALELIATVLTEDGHEVHTASDPAAALASLDTARPELIISDVLMPGMSGFDFSRALQQRLPAPHPPLVFLTSLDDADHVVKGLELGADDYLTKPVHAAVLRAKVRALLRRERRAAPPAVVGRLEACPPARVLQLCELKGITGELELAGEGLTARLALERGQLAGELDLDLLDRALALTAGTFAIRPAPLQLDEPAPGAAADASPADPLAPGRLSSVTAAGRAFQILTELVPGREPRAVTVVAVDGRTAWKRAADAPPGADAAALAELVDAQHAAVEAEIAGIVAGVGPAPEPAGPSAAERFQRLFDAGVDASMRGDHQAALVAWEEARTLDPANRTLEVNLAIVRRKLGTNAP